MVRNGSFSGYQGDWVQLSQVSKGTEQVVMVECIGGIGPQGCCTPWGLTMQTNSVGGVHPGSVAKYVARGVPVRWACSSVRWASLRLWTPF